MHISVCKHHLQGSLNKSSINVLTKNKVKKKKKKVCILIGNSEQFHLKAIIVIHTSRFNVMWLDIFILLCYAFVKIPVGTPERAMLTTPSEFSIRRSRIPGANLGVWSDNFVPQNTVLAEYEGDIEEHTKDFTYSWQVRE